VGEHFAVHKQVTRADLHWWNYHNGAATCMGGAAVRAPGDSKHCIEENSFENHTYPGIFVHRKFILKSLEIIIRTTLLLLLLLLLLSSSSSSFFVV
jgi:hypothetical protein